MSKQLKHAKEIVQWAMGAKIQVFTTSIGWIDCKDNTPAWAEDCEYRIKPAPKPDYVHFLRIGHSGTAYVAEQVKANVKCVFDGETHELKEAIVL
jgi:hypothetical protein